MALDALIRLLCNTSSIRGNKFHDVIRFKLFSLLPPSNFPSAGKTLMTSQPFPEPSRSGRAEFTPPGTDLKCQTSYRIWGDLENLSKNLPPLIGLHGGPGCPSQSLAIFARLHEVHGITTILYDQVGCGDSTHLPDTRGDESFWMVELFIAELKNLIASLGIKEYSIFGHSWGAMLASEFALTQPPGLKKLILCSGPACTAVRVACTERQKAALPGDVPATLKKFEDAGDIANPEYQKAMHVFYQQHLCRVNPMPAELGQALKAMREDDTVYATMYGTSPLKLTGPMKDFDIRDKLYRITESTVPGGVMLVNGKYDTAQDEVIMPFFNNIRARVKWVRFADSSHMSFWEETEEFFAVLAAFLEAAS